MKGNMRRRSDRNVYATDDGKVTNLSAYRLARIQRLGRSGDTSEFIGKQLVNSDLAGRDLLNNREVLGRNGLPLDPLRDPALRDPNSCSELGLTPNDLNGALDGACRLFDSNVDGFGGSHSLNISAATISRQQRRCWESPGESISVANMPSDKNKRAKPTAADLEAAKRLRAIRDAMDKRIRPTQQKIAEDFDDQQSVVSQYYNGRIPLNFRAVMVFAKHLKCAPEEIRNDLPELALMQGQSTPVAPHHGNSAMTEADAHRVFLSFSAEDKMLAIRLIQEIKAAAAAAGNPKAQQTSGKTRRAG